jgi:hypothetical protein
MSFLLTRNEFRYISTARKNSTSYHIDNSYIVRRNKKVDYFPKILYSKYNVVPKKYFEDVICYKNVYCFFSKLTKYLYGKERDRKNMITWIIAMKIIDK